MTKSTTESLAVTDGHARSRLARRAKFTGVYQEMKQYHRVSTSQRTRFIDLIATKRFKICDAARECSIPYENAKCIYQVYMKEGRVQRLYQIREDRSRQPRDDGMGQPSQNSPSAELKSKALVSI